MSKAFSFPPPEPEFRFGFTEFKPGEAASLAAPEENLFCPENVEHCWHPSRVQHAMQHHRDDICCHCGQGRCVNWQPSIPAGHGQFHPGAG